MELTRLVENLQRIEPRADAVHIARLALLLTKDGLAGLDEPDLAARYGEMLRKVGSLHDQQLAVAEELRGLAAEDACEFSPNHVWTLVRGLKVQSQLLQMYLD